MRNVEGVRVGLEPETIGFDSFVAQETSHTLAREQEHQIIQPDKQQ